MILLYITAPSFSEAKKISNALLEKHLIACANIVQSTSFYVWKGKKVSEKEFIIYAKTSKKLAKKAEKLVKKLHSYECPCIIQIPVSANKEYSAWIESQTKP
ncbi:MAG TPA: divalent-cation tolerance protein CutA [archaeon]|nr:divalent-cation tolerance protein CutA [archaeon]